MINSMTGFGRGECSKENITFTVDIRTVNHRYSDISVRMPRIISTLEEKVRKYAKNQIKRGKVDIYINYSSFSQDAKVIVDSNLASAYVDSLKSLKEQFNIKDEISLSTLTRFQDILKLEATELDMDHIWSLLQEALNEAFEKLLSMRKSEGAHLQEDLENKLAFIIERVAQIKLKSENVVEEYKHKLYERIKELTKDVQLDENRLMTEVAIFADKSSIDEELVRLESHVQEFKKALTIKDSIGKKLDFILQEMNREVNTIGSKTSDVSITAYVIDMKTEIEKIREQVQNIE